MELHFQHVKEDHSEFLRLTKALDDYFYQIYGALTLQYQKHHDLAALDCRMLAIQDESAVGCGGWQRLDETTAEIRRIFVAPEQRRQGIAWTLLRILENDAGRQGCNRTVIAAGAEEYGALAFYQSCGYSFCSAFGNFTDDKNCVFMEKWI